MSEYLEGVQRVREMKKIKKNRDKRVEFAQKILKSSGVLFDADWMDISYRGEKYRPILLENDTNQSDEELIIITAKKIK